MPFTARGGAKQGLLVRFQGMVALAHEGVPGEYRTLSLAPRDGFCAPACAAGLGRRGLCGAFRGPWRAHAQSAGHARGEHRKFPKSPACCRVLPWAAVCCRVLALAFSKILEIRLF